MTDWDTDRLKAMADPWGYSRAAADVLAERARQVSEEGWTAEHDDQHRDHSLAGAAACYALGSKWNWPASWDSSWWKPKDRRRDLVCAAALLIAEIERLDRAALKDGEDRG